MIATKSAATLGRGTLGKHLKRQWRRRGEAEEKVARGLRGVGGAKRTRKHKRGKEEAGVKEKHCGGKEEEGKTITN